MNILSSDYFKELYKLKTYHEVIDEIYNQVDHVEPWMTGNCRGPSTAFCLLYKFFTMKLTVKQMHGLLKHKDSPYIRAIGFLYLRYAGDPKTLWGWFEPYVKDDEEFSPGSNGRMTTMGVYVRDLLLGQAWELWNEERGLELIDPLLNDLISEDEFLEFMHIALLCVSRRRV
ncbi:Pre-mRNA-splicing factor 38 [Dillenia turbinata]|uniref:Pre-mRNA-splicing factor 38 n=1 Tax=Dillenia turbinata TaxID=194707 RepID=A0AAN8VE39_9MAGN